MGKVLPKTSIIVEAKLEKIRTMHCVLKSYLLHTASRMGKAYTLQPNHIVIFLQRGTKWKPELRSSLPIRRKEVSLWTIKGKLESESSNPLLSSGKN